MECSDLLIIGGGIVGLATAYRFQQRRPGSRVVVVEKEPRLAAHQTGHNSGVLHSGIYYKPGSLKARNCREGKRAMEAFCREHGIDFDVCGKVIVATREAELPKLQTLFERGQANGVACEMIERDRLRELEPHAAGIRAIHVPEAGIVNFRQVCERLAQLVREAGGEIVLNAPVRKLAQRDDRAVVQAGEVEHEAKVVVNAAGLYSDKLTRLSGQKPEAKIVPFRGEYFQVKPEARRLCRNLIYPVPDPAFPFLGVHFTRMIGGHVECGPNAVLAFRREGYRKWDIHLPELFESITYSGFLRLAMRHWRMGAMEMWRSWSKAAFVRSLQRLVPEVTADDLEPGPAGVRAQALKRDGSLVDDFLIQENGHVVNICNAPSPAATASLSIGDAIVDRIDDRLC